MSELTRALCAVMQAVPYIQRTGFNDHHRFSYASESDLLAHLQPQMAKHGLALVPVKVERTVREGPTARSGRVQWVTDVTVTWKLLHTSGEFLELQTAGSGVDGEDKGIYKALTGALKYALRHAFLMPTGDDPDAGAAEPSPAAPTRTEPPTWFVEGLQRLEFDVPFIEGFLSWVQGRSVQVAELSDEKLRSMLEWLATGPAADKVAAYLDHVEGKSSGSTDEASKPLGSNEHHPSWQFEANDFHALLDQLGLTLAEVVDWCAAKGRPGPHQMDRDQRAKLAAYLRDANGATQVRAWAAEKMESAA